MNDQSSPGPLAGLRVLEFEAIGPAPFCGMLLADMGADVLLVERPAAIDLGGKHERRTEVMLRGRRSVTLDLKSPQGVEAALALVRRADALIEGFRPGVMERIGLSPEVALAANARLVYGRMTGWGQEGPLAPRAGHDINYIAQSGVLNAIGRKGDKPVPPLNLVGDFGGGGMLLAFGLCCALMHAQKSGRGQVVDAAMIDGASLLTSMFWGMLAGGTWTEQRGSNVVDTGAPWYEVYETRDGLFVSIGPIEARFYAEFIQRLGIASADLPQQNDSARWPELRERYAQAFKQKTRAEWCALFEGTDACFAPVLSFSESMRDAHSVARKAFINVGGIDQPAPAPRLSLTPAAVRSGPPERGQGARQALLDWGLGAEELKKFEV